MSTDSDAQFGTAGDTVTAQGKGLLENPNPTPVVKFNREVGEKCWIIQRGRVKARYIEEITAARTTEKDEVRIKLVGVRKSLEVTDVFFELEEARNAFFAAHLDEEDA